MKDYSSIVVYYKDGTDEYESDRDHWYGSAISEQSLYIYKNSRTQGDIVSTVVYPHREWTRVISDK